MAGYRKNSNDGPSAEDKALEPMLSENIIKLQIIDNHI